MKLEEMTKSHIVIITSQEEYDKCLEIFSKHMEPFGLNGYTRIHLHRIKQVNTLL